MQQAYSGDPNQTQKNLLNHTVFFYHMLLFRLIDKGIIKFALNILPICIQQLAFH